MAYIKEKQDFVQGVSALLDIMQRGDRRDERHSEESITEDNPRYTLEMR